MPKPSGIDTGTLVNVALVAAIGLGLYKAYDVFFAGGDVQGGDDVDPRLPDGTVIPTIDPPTMTREAARILANRVYAAIYGDGGMWTTPVEEDGEAVIAAMLPPRTDGDVLLIAEEYGLRDGPWWAPTDYTLEGVIRAYLEPTEVARINNDYAARGINIRF